MSGDLFISRLYCCMQYDQLLTSYCRMSVRSSVTLSIMVLRVGVALFRHFCCKTYRLAKEHSDQLKCWQASKANLQDVKQTSL